MGLVNLYDDSDAEDVARRIVSTAYTGSDWCEEGSIRKDILELNEVYSELGSLVKRHRQDVIQLKKDIDGLRVTIQELVAVTEKHNAKLLVVATSLGAIDKMLKMLGDKTYDD